MGTKRCQYRSDLHSPGIKIGMLTRMAANTKDGPEKNDRNSKGRNITLDRNVQGRI
jgi:hypothetical protein